jgi:hypothetical protein
VAEEQHDHDEDPNYESIIPVCCMSFWFC